MAIIYTINLLCPSSDFWALNRTIELVLQRRDSLLIHNFSKVGSWIWVSLNVTVDFMFCAVGSSPITKCTIMERSLFAVTKHVESALCVCVCVWWGWRREGATSCLQRTHCRAPVDHTAPDCTYVVPTFCSRIYFGFGSLFVLVRFYM